MCGLHWCYVLPTLMFNYGRNNNNSSNVHFAKGIFRLIPIKNKEVKSRFYIFLKMSRFRKLFHKYIVVQKSTHNHTTSQLLCQISKRSLHTAQFSCLPLSRSSEFYEEGTCSNSLPPNRLERYIANIASLDRWLVDSKPIIDDPMSFISGPLYESSIFHHPGNREI